MVNLLTSARHEEVDVLSTLRLNADSSDSGVIRRSLVTLVAVGALAAIWSYLDLKFKSADDLVALGQIALNRHDFNSALSYADLAITKSPDFAPAWKLTAEAAGQNAQFDRCLAALKEYSRFRSEDAGHTAVKLASSWMKRMFARPAVRGFQFAEKLSVEVEECLKMQERICLVTGHSREASRCIIELIKLDAYTRGDLLFVTSITPRLNDQKQLNAMLRANPADKSPLLAKSLDALQKNDLHERERLLIEITAADPDDLEAQGELGELYAQTFPERFLRWHSNLPTSAKDDARAWSARGKWLAGKDKVELAIRCLHESLVREPERLSTTALIGQLLKSQGLVELGNAFTERGRSLQRITDLSQRLQEPRSMEVIIPLIAELESTGRLWEAWGLCEIYKLLDPQNQSAVVEFQYRMKPHMKSKLPRTLPGSVPGSDFDWSRFPLPDWSQIEETDRSLEKSPASVAATIRFDDQTAQVGLDFQYVNSFNPENGRKIFETMGAGVASLDFDCDDWPDLYFPQASRSLPGVAQEPKELELSDILYRNDSGRRLINVTNLAWIHELNYSYGVAAGDYDNDGFPDLYIANFGLNTLYRNQGDGTFVDVTSETGIKQRLWTVTCGMADFNLDGMPELFDVNYAEGKELLTRICADEKGKRLACRPSHFDPTTDTVLLNLGDGQFIEKQSEAGLDLPLGMGLGLIIGDFNDDHRLDAFIANDMTANYLLINVQEDSGPELRFRDEGVLRGVAFDEAGLGQACMGVACADINRDQQLDLFVTNYFLESNTLYLSMPGGFYRDATRSADLREPSIVKLGFGTQFLDADRDGWYDLIVMNGHVDDFGDGEGVEYQMKPQFFRAHSNGRFTELLAKDAGNAFNERRLGRGMALLDWNRDGRTDFVATDLERSALLGVNRTDSPLRSLRLKLVGTRSSRDAIGAKVKVQITAGDERLYQLTAGDGYESSSERLIEICAGGVQRLQRMEIRWPSGAVSAWDDIDAFGDWLAIENRSELIRR